MLALGCVPELEDQIYAQRHLVLMGQEFPKEAAGVRTGNGQCPRVGRPNFCRDIYFLMGQEFPKEAAGVRTGTGQCPKVVRPNICRETASF